MLLKPRKRTFAAPVNYGAGSSPSSVAAADLNGDGESDIIVANSNKLSVFLNLGNGVFPTAANHAVTGGQALAVADLNADGKLDIAVCVSGNVSVILSYGNGVTTVDTPAHAITTADLDGDGKSDFAVLKPSSVVVFRNQGNNVFAPEVTYGVAHLEPDRGCRSER